MTVISYMGVSRFRGGCGWVTAVASRPWATTLDGVVSRAGVNSSRRINRGDMRRRLSVFTAAATITGGPQRYAHACRWRSHRRRHRSPCRSRRPSLPRSALGGGGSWDARGRVAVKRTDVVEDPPWRRPRDPGGSPAAGRGGVHGARWISTVPGRCPRRWDRRFPRNWLTR